MKRHSLFLFVMCLLLGFLSGSSHTGTQISRYQNLDKAGFTAFHEILKAHGDPEAIASILGFNVCFARLTYTSPTEYFERHVCISVEGSKFKRLTADVVGRRSRYETLDDMGNFQSRLSSKGGTSEQLLTADIDRIHAVRASIGICSLLSFLQKFSQQTTEVQLVEGAPQELEKLRIRTPRGEYNIFADQEHLIRRIEFTDIVFEFADYRSTGSMKLPYVQRVSLNNRLVYELFFSEIAVNPVFSPEYFTKPVWEASH